MKKPETLMRVHTHTFNLMNKKEISTKSALLIIYIKDR